MTEADLRFTYGVATIRRLLKILGLFCRISSLLKGSFAKETYNFKEPTNRSHPISDLYDSDITEITHIPRGAQPRAA